ncbi:DUF6932 family protein [Brucella tritici]|uniref:Polymerase nucleotidyl transferase domain-containing protein n=1 Tax=Brucella tritici TaxID=94626 RepID=A0A6L3YMV0_9HYPH|nr:hypothetical protein [Brucella tritici]KAB2684398.1 hypothetical protein F9L08_14000 [Brucella tritici]
MCWSTFVEEYGFNQRRIELIHMLQAELAVIASKGWAYRVYIFGSFIKEPLRAVPGDIDVLLSISQPFGAERWYQAGRADLHIKHIVMSADPSTPATLRAGKTAQEMISVFNEGCQLTGEKARIDGDGSDLVELI